MKKRATALMDARLPDQLCRIPISKLEERRAKRLPSKPRVVGSSPTRDAIKPELKCSQQLFTKDLLDSFIISRASGISSKILRLYRLVLKRFIGYPLTSEGINDYLSSLSCGNAKHNYFRCINTVCNWLHKSGYVPDNPILRASAPGRQRLT